MKAASAFVVSAFLLFPRLASGEPSRKETPGASTNDVAPPKPWAQGVSSERQERALGLFREGNAHLGELRYEDARGAYEAAVQHWKHPAIYFNLAICHVHGERPIDALAALELALAFGEAPLGPEVFQEALTYQKLLRAQFSVLSVEVVPAQATVKVDGKEMSLEAGALRLELLAGAHVISVEHPGYAPATRQLRLVPGTSPPLHIQLSALLTPHSVYERPLPVAIPYLAAGTGVLVAASGIVLRQIAEEKLEQYDAVLTKSCSPGCKVGAIPDDAQTLRNDSSAFEASATVAMALGGTLLTSGVLLAIWNQPAKVTESRTKMSLSFAGASVSVRGQF